MPTVYASASQAQYPRGFGGLCQWHDRFDSRAVRQRPTPSATTSMSGGPVRSRPRRVASMRAAARILASVSTATSIGVATMAVPADAIAPARPVYVNCWHQAPGPTLSGYFVARAHAGRCTLWGSPEDLADLYVLRHLRWRDWGRAVALLQGQVRNTHPEMGGPLWSPMTARLSRIRRGCDGYGFYTRMTFPGRSAATVRLSDACEPSQ